MLSAQLLVTTFERIDSGRDIDQDCCAQSSYHFFPLFTTQTVASNGMQASESGNFLLSRARGDVDDET